MAQVRAEADPSLDEAWTRLSRARPPGLDALRALIAATGRPEPAVGSPARHPLVLRLGADAPDAAPLGLLVWPTPDPGAELPVVREHAHHLELMAPSAADAVRAWLGGAELAGRPVPVDVDAGLYITGEAAASGLSVSAWRVRHAGGSLPAYAALLARHAARGDWASADITAQAAISRFDGWGLPHAWRIRTLRALGHDTAARDAAVAALSLPVWTLSGPAHAHEVAAAAGWSVPIDGSPFSRHADDAARPPADRAAWRLDAAAMDGRPWQALRAEVAELWRVAGLADVAWLAER